MLDTICQSILNYNTVKLTLKTTLVLILIKLPRLHLQLVKMSFIDFISAILSSSYYNTYLTKWKLCLFALCRKHISSTSKNISLQNDGHWA